METNARTMIYLGDHTALTRTIYHHKIFVDTRDISLAPHILLDGFWENWITKVFISLLQPGMTVVDVGANIGYYSLIAGTQVSAEGKIISFEANPAVFRLLSKSIEVNGFLGRAELVNKGVMDKAGELAFHTLRDHHGSSSFLPEAVEQYRDRDCTGQITVQCVSLDEFFCGRNDKIDVLKIDAEGAENHIIAGAAEVIQRNPQIKILMEYSESNRPAVERLLSWGFHMQNIEHDSSLKPLTLQDLLDEKTTWGMLFFAHE
jgi:FkbM family methyltransferase